MGMRTSANSIFTRPDVPGPGTYVPQNITFTSPKFSMKGKSKHGTNIIVNSDGTHDKVASSMDCNVPGPGTYSASHKQVFTSLSTKFGSEVRPSMGAKDAGKQPAPNSYERDAKSAVLKR